jgi:hypothetical protein
MSEKKNNNLNNNSSCSSSSVGPAKVNPRIHPIFNHPRLLPAFYNVPMEQKMNALDLSIGIKNQKGFVNYGHLDAKARKPKDVEDLIQEVKKQPIEEDEYFPKATHLARKLIDTDPDLDFMDSDRRGKLIEDLIESKYN